METTFPTVFFSLVLPIYCTICKELLLRIGKSLK
jgi:hypothetical protein